jgi:Ceramidase
MREATNPTFFKSYWRHFLMLAIVFGSLLIMMSQKPFGQNPDYHNFADRRMFFGIPNFFDVASNLAFLIVGALGLKICFDKNLGALRSAWIVMFAGITLVSVGSAYYHWNPNNQTLVWDRLPMTIGFMGLFTALLGEYISEKFGALLVPAVLVGLSSVLCWYWFDDLRFYIWVQLIPLLTILVIMLLYRAKYSHQWLLILALVFYALAKIAELGDGAIFGFTQDFVSGHTIKHLLSAFGCLAIVLMLRRRQKINL